MITSLSLEQYRNMTSFELSNISPITIFTGPNGVGKTNSLEAIALAGGSQWRRYRKISEVVQWGQSYAGVELHFSNRSINEIRFVVKSNKAHYLVDKQTVRAQRVQHELAMMVFTPSMVMLFSGEPEPRRQFLDSLLQSLYPEYAEALSQYKKVLKMRNAALKQKALSQLPLWEDQLATHATVILLSRQWLLRTLTDIVDLNGTCYYTPSPQKIAPLLEYRPQVREMLHNSAGKVREYLRDKWATLRDKELIVGFSLMGPQRDDWGFRGFFSNSSSQLSENEIDVGMFGSRGQERLSVIKVQLAGLSLLEEYHNYGPLWLLDDVFAELDSTHQQYVVDACQKYQTFITSTNKEYPGIRNLLSLDITNLVELPMNTA
ncbi:DNA replication and repair protein RecF [candidate division WWE3 bacterium]|uniref:DNA replication and repair protein RecF n=1 Tax=candidate division WWE3 bacterium TaxID=2053526 RepID=A0A955LW02_UNCKA|nr:DNA replication and repair protein RecF [candidate division WWE3 bacterium]